MKLEILDDPKFQASSLLLWLSRPVCVGPGRKLKLLVFSCEDSNRKTNEKSNLEENWIHGKLTEILTLIK